jgi:asparagine synthase (glutamine-hydrolysing)
MCGIAGVIGADSEPAVVAGQLDLLTHRGPDARGISAHAGAVIGQTRLAVIDLDTGDPPIANEDATVSVALNGEIYNFLALREELAAAGHVLATAGDTEVIAHLAEDLDPVALARRLDGMFAFAVWDSRRRRLVLGRDRLGKKPVYYCAQPGRFAFASEIKAVLSVPWVPRRLNRRAMAPYLAFGYVPTPETFYAGVLSLPPGHVLTLEPGREPRIERYWAPPLAGAAGVEPLAVSFEEAARLVRGGLEAAVSRRLIADVPLGAFLSGGLDSSAIVGIMAAAGSRPVATFTIGFEDRDGFDERPYARIVAERFATDHHEEVVAPDAVDLLETLVWHHDQPFGDSSAIPTYLLNRLTRGHVTVALSGDGGDELFGGYERFVAALLLGRYRRLPPIARRGVERLARSLPAHAAAGRAESLQRFVGAGARGLPEAYREWVGFMALGDEDWGARDYAEIWRASAGAAPLDRLLDLNLRTYLLDDLLVKADRMSMAHGLEVRSPFLDHHLLELAARLPPAMKVRGSARKRVLGAAVADLLPPEIRRRRKRGFGVPLDRWFRGELRGYMSATLGAADSRVRAHLGGDVLERVLGEHLGGSRNHGQVLWLLLTLEVWLRREGW